MVEGGGVGKGREVEGNGHSSSPLSTRMDFENFKSVYVIRGQKLLTTNMYQSTGNDAKRLENTFTGCAYSRPDLGNLTHDVLTL